MAHRSASLAIEPGDGGRLVWRVVIPSARPLGDFEVLVDAVSGRVVRTREPAPVLRATATRSSTTPTRWPSTRLPRRLRSDHQDRNTRAADLAAPVRSRCTTSGAASDCLRGQWVHAKLGGTSARGLQAGASRWNGVKRSEDRFEALMAYFHVDRAQRYIQGLGFGAGTANGIDDRRQVVVADAFRDDNSFYSPATRTIKYGSGGVDDAEDADVILHEYGHAIQDDQVPRVRARQPGGSDRRGLRRLLGGRDVLPVTGLRRNADDVCIFDWDGVGWGSFVPAFGRKCGRRADSDDTLPQAQASCGIDIHCVGEVWSSALWDLRDGIGGRDLRQDRALLPVHVHGQRALRRRGRRRWSTADQASTGGANKADDLHRDGDPARDLRRPLPLSAGCAPKKIDPPVSGRGNTGGSLGSDWPTFTRRGGVGGCPRRVGCLVRGESIGIV